jgi:hypothetical protein
MRPRAYARCLLIVALSASGWGQPPQQTVESQGFGSVVGHVYCADTNAPARFARVTLEPVEDFKRVDLDAKPSSAPIHVPSTTMMETRTDGSFAIEYVTPGTYYILVELSGYLSPLTEFASDEITIPAELDEKRIRTALQQVTVVRGQATRMDFRLERGAAISGRVLYDDGGYVADALVSVLRKEKDGSWKPFSDVALSRFHGQPATDDQGHYRIAPLTPGEYLVSIDLELFSVSTTGAILFGGRSDFREDSKRAVHIYFGDTARRSIAKTITIGKGENRSDADITVPISRLYTISGTVTAERDGHPVNSGSILLLDAVDRSTLVESSIGLSDERFAMAFVPEGDYILKISSAADSILETKYREDGLLMSSHLIPIHMYADTEQPLKVSGDTSGIVVKVMEKAGDSDEDKADSGKDSPQINY